MVYYPTFPPIDAGHDPGARVTRCRTSLIAALDGSLLLTDRLRSSAPTYDQLPVALMPTSPPNPSTQVTAMSEGSRAVRCPFAADIERNSRHPSTDTAARPYR